MSDPSFATVVASALHRGPTVVVGRDAGPTPSPVRRHAKE